MATIGPRTIVIDFPCQAVNTLFCCMYAVVGLYIVLEWDEGLVCLINLGVFGSQTDRARGLAFFSKASE